MTSNELFTLSQNVKIFSHFFHNPLCSKIIPLILLILYVLNKNHKKHHYYSIFKYSYLAFRRIAVQAQSFR